MGSSDGSIKQNKRSEMPILLLDCTSEWLVALAAFIMFQLLAVRQALSSKLLKVIVTFATKWRRKEQNGTDGEWTVVPQQVDQPTKNKSEEIENDDAHKSETNNPDIPVTSPSLEQSFQNSIEQFRVSFKQQVPPLIKLLVRLLLFLLALTALATVAVITADTLHHFERKLHCDDIDRQFMRISKAYECLSGELDDCETLNDHIIYQVPPFALALLLWCLVFWRVRNDQVTQFMMIALLANIVFLLLNMQTDRAYKTPYEILGVPEDAPFQDIRRAYRRLSMKYHPEGQHRACYGYY